MRSPNVNNLNYRALTLVLGGMLAFSVGCPTPPVDNPGGEGEGEGEGVPIDPRCDPTAAAAAINPEEIPLTYDCTAIDWCNNTDFRAAASCCECQPEQYCVRPGTCEPVGEGEGEGEGPQGELESCMACHNGAQGPENNYSGTGITNPHAFPGNLMVRCSQCHGGNPAENGRARAHVPPPPGIGDRFYQTNNPEAFFNFLTRAGIDKMPDYTVDGVTYTGKQYLQFMNPGDLRVVTDGVGCGECHADHAWSMANASVIGTEAGFFSSAMLHIGAPNAVGNVDWNDTANDYSFRGTQANTACDPVQDIGCVDRTIEVPEYAQYNGQWSGQAIVAADLANDIYAAADDPAKQNQVRPNSDLSKLYQNQISITCGDCHAGSAGANNRYADFRSSGCTVCHMTYSLDGKSRSTDRNVPKDEPFNPDAIAAGERPHVAAHLVRNVAKLLPNGTFIQGINDNACVGCHQGSNRTVLQYWGIRLDQNADLANNFQYPAAPVTFVNTANNPKLFDQFVNNNTFNGRNANQYIQEEDYDGDTLDDTPPDIHFERGMGCIDCHGSNDVHGMGPADAEGKTFSKMDQIVQIRCESCHGPLEAYATTAPCTDYLGGARECMVDAAGKPMRNTYRDNQGNFWLKSRLTGNQHFIPQTLDTVSPNNKANPNNGQLMYSPKASYAMGRIDGNPNNGQGPIQTNPAFYDNGFSHTDNMDCLSCHASWANQCIGCHLKTANNQNPANYFFSNITGERIITQQQNADFSYISPVMTYLGVNSKGKITQVSAGMKVFYQYIDYAGNGSATFAFSSRKGVGNVANYQGTNAHPALGHYQMAPHTVRGKIDQQNEGPKYCVTCHLNVDQINNFGAAYADFQNNYYNNNYANLDFALLRTHIGSNPGNQLNSPFFVHSTAGLGTGLFLFDAAGCPVNDFDANANRFFCNGTAPVDNFANDAFNNVAYDADRFVELEGITNSSTLHPMLYGANLTMRQGSQDPTMSGSLGRNTLYLLTNVDAAQGGGIILDSWIDANSNAQGDAANYIQ